MDVLCRPFACTQTQITHYRKGKTHTNRKPPPVKYMNRLFVSVSVKHSAHSSGCAGVFIPVSLHMVEISEQSAQQERVGALTLSWCLSGASLWGLKNLFVYPRVRSGFRSRAPLLTAHQGSGLLPLATYKNCC